MWVVFFVFAGGLNIYVAYNYAEETWVNFKLFGLLGLTFVFIVAQSFWLAQNMKQDAHEQRARATIEQLLVAAFAPSELLVKDQSHLHAGHAGAQEGKGHFEVKIVSDRSPGRAGLRGIEWFMMRSALSSIATSTR